jgi:hypothetical protein
MASVGADGSRAATACARRSRAQVPLDRGVSQHRRDGTTGALRRRSEDIMRILVGLLLTSSCVINTESVTEYNDSIANSSRSIPINGLTTERSGTVQAQVLTSLYTSERDPAATWQTIGTFTASSTGTTSGDTDYYGWNGTLTNFTQNTWPTGGVARVRMLYNIDGDLTAGFTFDDLGCPLSNPGDFESDAFACAGHDNGHMHLVDGNPVSRSSKPYISLRETPQVKFQGNIVTNPPADYYAQIDPTNQRTTLAAFKARNGFSATNTALPGYEPVVAATYFNRADLELGRRMFCVRKVAGGAVACFVTNYGDPAQPPPGPQDAEAPSLAAAVSQNAAGLVATVAMEYRPNDAANRVTFLAYNSVGVRAELVELDTEGAKAIPGACLSCHGGRFNAAADRVTGAHFLPFDVDNFGYSSTAGYSLASQQNAFRALNNLVLATGPTTPITDLVNGWYGSNLGTTGPIQNTDFVPVGWAGQELMYREVVKPYCRSCHVALDVNNFTTYDSLKFSAAKQRACDNDFKDMPHAQVTRRNFWESTARGHLIGEFSWATPCD